MNETINDKEAKGVGVAVDAHIRLIKLYEDILYGTGHRMGLLDCYDTYYSGCWDEQFEKIKTIKEKLGAKA